MAISIEKKEKILYKVLLKCCWGDKTMRDVKSVYIVGRKNPDVDSITSSLGYAELKNIVDKKNKYVATVSGDIDLNTQKVLSYFNTPLPKYILDLQLRVEDVMTKNVIQVGKDTPITEVFKIMLKNDLRVVPIVDSNNDFFGYFGMIDIARKSISSVMPDIFRKIKTSIPMIAKAVGGEILHNSSGESTFIANVIMGVIGPEGLMKIIERFDPENIVIILGNRDDLQKKAIDLGVRCVVVSNGYKISNELLERAKQKEVSIILSDFDAFATAGLIEWSAPVETLVDKSEEFASPDELINDIKEVVYRSSNRSVIVVDNDKKVVGIVTRTDIIKYNRREVILIDHSSSTNAPKGIFYCDILEIIDHHKLGNIQTGYPTRYRIEPWGATSSIILDEFRKYGVKPSALTAALLASGIILNTHFLKDDKITDNDRGMLEWACTICGKSVDSIINEVNKAINS